MRGACSEGTSAWEDAPTLVVRVKWFLDRHVMPHTVVVRHVGGTWRVTDTR